MKGNEKLLTVFNHLLAHELTVVNQYMVHAEMCDNWGYGKLHDAIQKQAIDEMHHAESLIQRILFLEGMPIVSKLDPLTIGTTVPDMISNDQEAELAVIHAYNAAAALAHEVNDQASVDLFIDIIQSEEEHEDWAEKQRTQIAQMGLENYLNNQT
jgi:bacterioferritin